MRNDHHKRNDLNTEMHRLNVGLLNHLQFLAYETAYKTY